MKPKAIARYLTAAVLAAGMLTAVPEYPSGAGIMITASAETTSDGFVISDADGKRMITGYTGEGGAVKVPADADGIGAFAFSTNSAVTSLTVPSGVPKSFLLTTALFMTAVTSKP